MNNSYQRPFVNLLSARLKAPEPLIQVLVGPRQVGKTTGIRQLLQDWQGPWHYANADDLLTADRTWLLGQWQKGLALGQGGLLVIDEIQKVPNWPETIKSLWDANPRRLRVVLLGSSALQLHSGLSESLAGRFELIRVYHWGFNELKQAFGYSLDRYLGFGGYPGAVEFEENFDRWYAYLKESIVESVIGKDILQVRRVANPVLFRQAFELLCHYPAQEISYTKLLGQLQDRGNVTLVKNYLELYEGAFMVRAIQKYSEKPWLSRASSPKILPACPALVALAARDTNLHDSEGRGRVFELAVGLALSEQPGELFYWREKNLEVDFVYRSRGVTYAIEVKSGRKKSGKGLSAFCERNAGARPVVIRPDNFEQFCSDPVGYLSLVT
jgi:uncharacterized protein